MIKRDKVLNNKRAKLALNSNQGFEDMTSGNKGS